MLILAVIFRKGLLNHWKLVAIGTTVVLGLFLWKGGSFIQRGISIADLQEADIASRFSAWKSTLQMIKEHPLLGTGLDTYVLKFRQYMSVDYEHLAGKLAMAGFAHNHFLQVASDLGLIGLGIYLWLLLTFFITCFGSLQSTRHKAQGTSDWCCAGRYFYRRIFTYRAQKSSPVERRTCSFFSERMSFTCGFEK